MDNTRYYSEVISRHGMSAQGVHWNSQSTQYRRFEVLLSMIELNEDASIVDAGAGFGVLYSYLQERNHPFKSYIGLELMVEMVAIASKTLTCDLRVCDVLVDTLPKADYYVCSGGMNIMSREASTLFIRRCLDASAKGFVFNLLEGDDESLVYNYYRPQELVRLAQELGVVCTIKRGYLPKDFTVLFSKIDPKTKHQTSLQRSI